jgi:hypothetical protein
MIEANKNIYTPEEILDLLANPDEELNIPAAIPRP